MLTDFYTCCVFHIRLCCMTYTNGGILVQLVFGCNPKACAVAASGPGQVDCRLQLVAHLLVDGATKLCPVIALKIICKADTFNMLEVLVFSLLKHLDMKLIRHVLKKC